MHEMMQEFNLDSKLELICHQEEEMGAANTLAQFSGGI
jgi:hypothetical protein